MPPDPKLKNDEQHINWPIFYKFDEHFVWVFPTFTFLHNPSGEAVIFIKKNAPAAA